MTNSSLLDSKSAEHIDPDPIFLYLICSTTMSKLSIQPTIINDRIRSIVTRQPAPSL